MALPPWFASNEISIVIAAALLAGVNPEQAACVPQARTTAFHAWFARLHQAGEAGDIEIRWEGLSQEEMRLLSQLEIDDQWAFKWAIENRGWIAQPSLANWLLGQGFSLTEIPKGIHPLIAPDAKEANGEKTEHTDLTEVEAAIPDDSVISQVASTARVDELGNMFSATYQEFWANYDPEDPASTRPQQMEIVAWIMKNYHLSQTKAIAVEKLLCPINRAR